MTVINTVFNGSYEFKFSFLKIIKLFDFRIFFSTILNKSILKKVKKSSQIGQEQKALTNISA